jgi:hypothetical protein
VQKLGTDQDKHSFSLGFLAGESTGKKDVRVGRAIVASGWLIIFMLGGDEITRHERF